MVDDPGHPIVLEMPEEIKDTLLVELPSGDIFYRCWCGNEYNSVWNLEYHISNHGGWREHLVEWSYGEAANGR